MVSAVTCSPFYTCASSLLHFMQPLHYNFHEFCHVRFGGTNSVFKQSVPTFWGASHRFTGVQQGGAVPGFECLYWVLYNLPTLRKIKIKLGQITDKLEKKTLLQGGRMWTGRRIKDLSLHLIIFGLFCLHIDTKCHERTTLNAVKKWKNKAVLWLSVHFFTLQFCSFKFGHTFILHFHKCMGIY